MPGSGPLTSRDLIDVAPLFVVHLDNHARVLWFNRKFAEMVGVSADAAAGGPFFEDFVAARDHARGWEGLARTLAGEEGESAVLAMRRRDGKERLVEWQGQVLRAEGGRVESVVAVGTDLTERLRAERARAAERDAATRCETPFETLVAASPVGVFRTDAAGACEFVSPRWCELTGVSGEAARGGRWQDAVHPDDRAEVLRSWSESVAEGLPFRAEYRFRGRGGDVWVLGQAAPMFGREGAITGWIGTVTDITELREARERLATAQRLAGLGAWEADLRRGRSWWSEQQWRLMGRDPSPDGMLDLAESFSVLHPEDAARVTTEFERLLARGSSSDESYRIVRPDGTVRHLQGTARVAYDEAGRPARASGINLDVTEQVRVQTKVAEQARLLEQLFAHTLDRIAVLDRDFRFVRVSSAYAAADGKMPDWFPGRNHFEVYPSDFQAEAEEARRVKRPLRRQARPFVYADAPERGTTYWDLGLVPILDDQDEVELLLLNLMDVTARVRAEQEVEHARDLLRRVVDSSPDWIYALDRDGRFLLVNQAFGRAMGARPEVLVGSHVAGVLPDGASAAHTMGCEMIDLQRAYAGETVRRPRAEVGLPDGTRRVFDSFTVPLSRDGASVYGVLVHARDVTESVRAAEALEATLAERDTLLREVHHRVKNNLQVIVSLLQLHRRRVGSLDGQDALEELRQRIMAMSLVHERLYRTPDLSRVEFGDYVRTLVPELVGSIARDRRVRIAIDADVLPLPIETAMPAGLIITELVTNVAKYAFPDRAPGTARVIVRAAPGRAEIHVEDDGVGFPVGFDPTRGTTFGWELVRGLTRQIDGTLWATNDGGARVRLTFPVGIGSGCSEGGEL